MWGLLNQFEICVPRELPEDGKEVVSESKEEPIGLSLGDIVSDPRRISPEHSEELIVPACVTVKKSKSLQQLHQSLEESLSCKMARRYSIDFLLPALFNRLCVRLNDDVLPIMRDSAGLPVSADFWDNGLGFYRGSVRVGGEKSKRLLSPRSASAAAFPLSTVAGIVGSVTGSSESAESEKRYELLLLCQLKDTAMEEQCFHRTLEVTVLGSSQERDSVRELFMATNTTIENFIRDRYPPLLHHISVSCLVYSTSCIGEENAVSSADAEGEANASRSRGNKRARAATCYEIAREFCIDQLMEGETSLMIDRPGIPLELIPLVCCLLASS